MSNLFSNPNAVQPDLRIKFRLILSANDYTGVDKRVQIAITELWRTRGENRLIETMRQLGKPVEAYCIKKEYTYKGKPKVKYFKGERLKEYFFKEPVVCFVRMKKSNNISFDIANLLIKPVVDGFVDGRLIVDDNDAHLLEVNLRFHGIDKSLDITKDQKAERAAANQKRRDAGKNPKRQPPPNKLIVFDFYRQQRLFDLNPRYLDLHELDFNLED